MSAVNLLILLLASALVNGKLASNHNQTVLRS